MCIRDRADTPEASLDRSNTSAILRACVAKLSPAHREIINLCLLYTSDAADERSSVDLGGRRIIKKKKQRKQMVRRIIV